MRIGELAAAVGISPKTIRFYEAIGVLPPPRRSPSGYRTYGAADRTRLRFVALAKARGFTLGRDRRDPGPVTRRGVPVPARRGAARREARRH